MGLRRKIRTFRAITRNRPLFEADERHLSHDAAKLYADAAEPGACREDFLELVDTSGGSILEIGPYFAPCFSGETVRYFDVFSTEELRANAQKDPNPAVAPETVPEIHYHDCDGDMSAIPEMFDIAFSSHCIEHQPDLVGHLNQVHDLLKPGGRYFVIAPDKRFCFDQLRPESTLGEVVQAAQEKRRRHTLKTVVDHYSMTTHNESLRHWQGDHLDPGWRATRNDRIGEAIEKFNSANGAYIDAHAWQFTPARFLQILLSINALGLTGMRPERVWSTPTFLYEFTAILVRD